MALVESIGVSPGNTVLRRAARLYVGGLYYLSGTHLTFMSVMGTGGGEEWAMFFILNIFPIYCYFFRSFKNILLYAEECNSAIGSHLFPVYDIRLFVSRGMYLIS